MKGTRALNWRGCLGTHSWEQWLVCGRPGMFSAHGVPAHGWLVLLQMTRQSDAAAPQPCSHTRQDAIYACQEKNASCPCVKAWSSVLIPGAACCKALRRQAGYYYSSDTQTSCEDACITQEIKVLKNTGVWEDVCYDLLLFFASGHKAGQSQSGFMGWLCLWKSFSIGQR